MSKFDFLNDYQDSVCVFSQENELLFKNKMFESVFSSYKSFERFKKRFNFSLCFLSSDYLKEITPLDVLLESKENFHTICSFQDYKEDFLYYYIYSFSFENYKVVVFKDVTTENNFEKLSKKYNDLSIKFQEVNSSNNKFLKQQEHSQSQILKMGIINRISLVIRETSDMETILASALEEINNLLGSYKTYFSMREKSSFRIMYSIPHKYNIEQLTDYEVDVISTIKNKEISISHCIKEYLNAEEVLPRGITRIIIPVYNKNRLLGIIVTFTKQKVAIEEHKEILQSISVQLASSIIQSGLITQLNKKNKKLEKMLNELKEMQLQLINSEKMASLGQLVSGVAHEINTPLASISSNTALINRILSKGESLSKEQIDMLSELNSIDIEASNRISNIVKSLKRFVRLDEAEFQQADINKELDLTLKLIEHETKNVVEIKRNYKDLPPVYCSVNMLNQVFMNLLVNATHSIKEYKQTGSIVISTFANDKYLTVKIKDDGSGIPLDIQSKIFNVGFTTKKIGVGTGYGLSISKKIIELHKGSISFISKENEGTEFTIVIPITN